MTPSAWFWIFYVLTLIAGIVWSFRTGGDRWYFGVHFIVWILLGILGYAQFGGLVK